MAANGAPGIGLREYIECSGNLIWNTLATAINDSTIHQSVMLTGSVTYFDWTQSNCPHHIAIHTMYFDTRGYE
tara:strand:- start:645 stop:863 length:219 start_codon:yes stop_codon:yes gene_type:complete